MILGMMPAVTKPLEVQAANAAPAKEYWTDATGLGSFGMSSTDTTIGKIKFGAGNREWAICGKDGNDLALLSTTDFGTAVYGTTSNYSTSNFVNKLNSEGENYLSTKYFSTSELAKMQSVTASTNEIVNGYNTPTEVTDKKLYLPNSENQNSFGASVIYVGSGNNIAIDLSKLTGINGFQTNYFWLRSPDFTLNNFVLVARPGDSVGNYFVNVNLVSVVPAFNLNLPSVIFASAADAASSSYNGVKANGNMTGNTYTVRYASTGDETAEISADKKKIQVSNATSGMYLMVQNSDGVYIADASSNPFVNASSITIGGTQLTDFNNCKVWLESTDSDRITTAKMATQAVAPSTYDVTITKGNNMTNTSASGEESQSGITAGSAMTSVVYTADNGYYFPEDYSVAAVNDISVTRDSYTQITVSGTPSATTVITLTAATAKVTQSAPTGLSDGVDKIAGTTPAMEYASSADADSWNACSDGDTTVAA